MFMITASSAVYLVSSYLFFIQLNQCKSMHKTTIVHTLDRHIVGIVMLKQTTTCKICQGQVHDSNAKVGTDKRLNLKTAGWASCHDATYYL